MDAQPNPCRSLKHSESGVAVLCLLYVSSFLDAFAKLRLLVSSYLSVRPHGSTRLKLEGFSWNLIFNCFFENLLIKLKFLANLTWITCTLHAYLCTFMIIVCFWRDSPQWARTSSFTWFLYHTQRRTTFGRTPLDEWPACRRDFHLTTHNTHNRQTSMPPSGFEPAIPASERPQT